MKLGVRGRLFAFSVAIVVIVGGASALLLESQLRGWLTDRIDERLVRDLNLVTVMIEQTPPADDAALEALTHLAGTALQARVTMIRGDGVVVADSSLSAEASAALDNHGTRPEVVAAQERGEGRAMRYSNTLEQEMRYIAKAVTGARTVGTVRVSLSAQSIDETIARLRVFIGVAGLIGLLLALFMSALASQLFSGALRELVGLATRQVDRIQAGRGYELLPTDGPTEIAELARALNEMGSDLATALGDVGAERDRFRSMLDDMGVALLAVDREHIVTLSNQVTSELLGLSMAPEGRPLTDVLPEPGFQRHMARLRAPGDAGADPEAKNFVEMVLPGTRRTLLAHVTPTTGAGGGAVIVIQDITEMRRLESVRRDFVANVSHELRTPVSVIRANTETLLDGALEHPEMSRRFLDASLRNAQRLSKLIDDLLDLSRIEAGSYAVDIAPSSVALAASRTFESLKAKALGRSIALTVDVDEALSVMADPGALEQVLTNLVDNALKYGTDGGQVIVRGRRDGDVVLVEVQDDGPGIERRHRSRLFERFYRVDPGRSRDMGGTGLGLAIVKHLAASMGGTVGMEPVSPHGSRFWVQLPGAPEQGPRETVVGDGDPEA